jgi:hypothetical protein
VACTRARDHLLVDRSEAGLRIPRRLRR